MSNGLFTIPFWALFVIEDNEKGIGLHFSLHVPKYKHFEDQEFYKQKLNSIGD